MAFLTYVKSTTASWTKASTDLVVFGIFKDQTMTSIGLFHKNVRECVDCLTCEKLVGVTHRR